MSTDPRDNRIDYVEFPAPSSQAFKEALAFYKQVFGWTFQEWGDAYADTHGSGITMGMSSTPEHRPAAPLAVTYSSDLEGTRARVIAAGGKIVKDIIAFPGGRRFEYHDPAGNRLGVWSEK